jgi:hypothetical protein
MILRRDVDAFLESSAVKTTLVHVASSPSGYLSLLRHGPNLQTSRTVADPALWMSQRPWYSRGPLGIELAIRATRVQIGEAAARQTKSIEHLLGRRGVVADGPDAAGYFANGYDARIKGDQAGSNLTVIAYPDADVRVVVGLRTLAPPILGATLLGTSAVAMYGH